MKRLFIILSGVLLTISVFLPQQVGAQAPEKLSYQAVIRNASNALVTSSAVGMRVSILQGSATGTEVFKEIYNPNPQTNANGLVTLEIGTGIQITGTFASINWANGPYFIKTETDPSGGTSYTITGTSQILSVPYALHAKTAENISGGITETDPIFAVSPANGITSANITNWSTAYGWGDHASAGYLKSYTETDPIFIISPANGISSTNITNWNTTYGWGNHASAGYLKSYTETDPIFIASPANGISSGNITNWSTAYGWGNHASAGYVTLTGVQTLTNKTLTSPVINSPTGIVKANVGLGNVDNTTDLLKPISTATQTALALKAPLASPTFTGTVSGITSTMIGLGNVNNTTDLLKPISTATQAALALKAPLASPTLTGTPLAPTAAAGANTTQIATTAFVTSALTASVPAHHIGESYGGGIVFYVYDGGQHGLIASTADQSAGIQWYNGTNRYTGTTGDGLGAGAMNTAMIVATQIGDNQTGNFAAKVCADYSVTVGGIEYGDWYLPSIYELNLLYLQKSVVGGFNTSISYWTSTEYNDSRAFRIDFSGGGLPGAENPLKTSILGVRAIRAF